ncbi:MAG: PEP-CTERM-box response regulator transcription factor [Planctomycetes bacterium]|nr:PEP-CTERM-box response regulator transcription factor [Planctomycetota bacterium]|tara:strand:+ start:33 stop:1424 length:1392 start_codon:yes stop_codon:yes gene_type:complete
MKLLIVEDDLGLHSQYKWELEEFDTTFATDRDSAIEAIQKTQPDVVLLDLGLPPDEDNAEEGLRVLSAIMSQVPEAKVIVLTGSENHEHALRAQQLGACNYIQKGTDMAMVKYAIDSAYKMQSLERENKSLSERTISQTAIIGSSAAMQNAMKKTVRISKTPVSVMLSGESGTGKEMFANNIHSLSGRTGKFVAINCASIPGELLESVLFGHEKGAFTGANKRTIGKVELAQGGTLFLDEIGDMPHDLQAKMLRFLQERVVERVGGSEQVPVDVRIVCATHRDLKQMIASGTFREDLYFRLGEYILDIPPLRDRGEDVILLADHLLDIYREDLGFADFDTAKGFSMDAYSAMMNYTWSGNVREMQNRIRQAIINCETTLINAETLGIPLQDGDIIIPESWFVKNDDDIETLAEIREYYESRALFQAVRKANGNMTEAARIMDVARPTLYTLLDKYNMRKKSSS